MNKQERDKYFSRQYLVYGGFCGTCGEAVEPILNHDVATFGKCPHNGNHPKIKSTSGGNK